MLTWWAFLLLTSGNPPCPLARGAGDAVPPSELHIGELGHILSFTVLILGLVFQKGSIAAA